VRIVQLGHALNDSITATSNFAGPSRRHAEVVVVVTMLPDRDWLLETAKKFSISV
jgi:hypothetical protein